MQTTTPNPYAPPRAPLGNDGGAPREVVKAVRLLWADIALALPCLSITTSWFGVTELLIGMPILVLLALLPLQVARGRNWARITAILLYLATTRLTIPFLMHVAASPALLMQEGKSAVVSIVRMLVPIAQLVVGGIAVFFLLSKAARSWFTGPRDLA
jgi:hypothetical protein